MFRKIMITVSKFQGEMMQNLVPYLMSPPPKKNLQKIEPIKRMGFEKLAALACTPAERGDDNSRDMRIYSDTCSPLASKCL